MCFDRLYKSSCYSRLSFELVIGDMPKCPSLWTSFYGQCSVGALSLLTLSLSLSHSLVRSLNIESHYEVLYILSEIYEGQMKCKIFGEGIISTFSPREFLLYRRSLFNIN